MIIPSELTTKRQVCPSRTQRKHHEWKLRGQALRTQPHKELLRNARQTAPQWPLTRCTFACILSTPEGRGRRHTAEKGAWLASRCAPERWGKSWEPAASLRTCK